MSAPQAPDSDNIDPDTDWSFLARGDNALRLTAPPLPDTEQVLTGDEMCSLLKLAFQEIADGERIYLGPRLVWLAIALSCLTSQSLPVIFRALRRYMSHDKNPGLPFRSRTMDG